MAFTMPELREELEALGYGGIPDHVIISSLAQLKLYIPPSENDEKSGKDRSSSRPGSRRGKSQRPVHGSPVPGDREFGVSKKPSVSSRGAMDAVCFTPDFATELDEMRKMLRIMEGTKEKLSPPKRTQKKRVGLADEHEQYVGSLMDQWRRVGRTLRTKRNGYPGVVAEELSDFPNGVSNSESRECQLEKQDDAVVEIQHPTSADSATIRELEAIASQLKKEAAVLEIQLPLSADSATRRELEAIASELKNDDAVLEIQIPPSADSATTRELEAINDSNGCDPQAGHYCEGMTPPEVSESDEENRPEVEILVGEVGRENNHPDQGMCAGGSEPNSSEGELSASKRGKGIDMEGNGIDVGLVFTRKESFSAISPGVSYQQGGMLYPENFVDRSEHSDLYVNEEVLPSHQDPSDESLSSSPPSTAHTPKAVLDKWSALSDDQFLAAFEKSLAELDPRDTVDQETFANVNQKITDTASHPEVDFCNPSAARPGESENPPDLSAPLLRTPDRKGGGGQQSPLNDRSNIRIAEDTVVPHRRAKAVIKITEFNSSVTVRRNSAVTLKRSQSSRDSRRSERSERGERDEPNGPLLSDIVEDRVNSRLSVKTTTTTPPSSARKPEKVLRHSLSEKNSPRTPLRNKTAKDASQSHLDITQLGLSPVKVAQEPASPLKLLSSRERSCVANGLSEHRPGTCTVCPVRKSGDSTGSKSPYGKNVENVSGELDASPRLKLLSRSEAGGLAGASPTQKLPLRKGSAAPSGIYSPLDQKNHEVNSKVLHKTSRLASSMDYDYDSSRAADRRSPSLRSSTESSRSLGQRATSSQSSKGTSKSSPYAKSSSFNSLMGSRSTTSKDTLTLGGPRRAGKVDRVARFAEMQNLWKNDKFLKTAPKRKPQSFHRIFARLHLSHERYSAAYRERVLEDMRPSTQPPPFVVRPAAYNSAERPKTQRAFV